MSCNARLAFACRLFGSLFKTFAVLCTQQRCARAFGHTSSIAKPSAPSAIASCGSIVRQFGQMLEQDHSQHLQKAKDTAQQMGLMPPADARRTKSLEVLIPILYLKGVSTGDFEEALGALLGKDGGLSASTIARLKEAWVDEHARWLAATCRKFAFCSAIRCRRCRLAEVTYARHPAESVMRLR
jgi:hypothetical protein